MKLMPTITASSMKKQRVNELWQIREIVLNFDIDAAISSPSPPPQSVPKVTITDRNNRSSVKAENNKTLRLLMFVSYWYHRCRFSLLIDADLADDRICRPGLNPGLAISRQNPSTTFLLARSSASDGRDAHSRHSTSAPSLRSAGQAGISLDVRPLIEERGRRALRADQRREARRLQQFRRALDGGPSDRQPTPQEVGGDAACGYPEVVSLW